MISSSTRVLQVNLNRSAQATESALQIAVELKIDLVVVQEPWILHDSQPPNSQPDDYSNAQSILHPSFVQILPKSTRLRPRTLVYVSRSFGPLVSISTSSPHDPDLLAIDIIEGNAKIHLLNIYNQLDQQLHTPTRLHTLDRLLYNYSIPPNTILLGDFNTHHPWWDPLAYPTQGADQLVEWLDDHELELVNTPGEGTFFRPNLARPSVLDLAFTTSTLTSRIKEWQILPNLGSDHFGILFTIMGTKIELVSNPTQLAHFNTDKANWDLFASSF